MMMTRITMIKKQGSKETLRLMTIEELAEQIRQGAFAEQVQRLRTYYPLLQTAGRVHEVPTPPAVCLRTGEPPGPAHHLIIYGSGAVRGQQPDRQRGG